MTTVAVFAAATGAAFCSTFLRGFQNKNVAAGLKGFAFGTGYFMNLADIALVSIVAHVGSDASIGAAMQVGAVSAVGAGAGYVASMFVHDRLLKKKYAAERKAAKEKLKTRVAKYVARELESKDVDRTSRTSTGEVVAFEGQEACVPEGIACVRSGPAYHDGCALRQTGGLDSSGGPEVVAAEEDRR
ncbi:hypothetical protein D3C87_1299220 [compost metagenome]